MPSDPALLFVDCETSGLIDRGKPIEDPSQPWVVSIAAELTDIEGISIGHFAVRIKADGRTIKPGAEKVHGISAKAAGRGGVSEQFALGMLAQFVAQIPYGGFVIGYGVDFDRDVILGTMLRGGMKNSADRWSRPGVVFRDMKDACTPFCRVPSGKDDDGYKWPTLDIAGEVLCGISPRTDFHSSYDDATRSRRVYFELVRRKVIDAPSIKERDAE